MIPKELAYLTLHSHNFPAYFMCRYYLPLEVERNSRLLSVSFEVHSHSGDLKRMDETESSNAIYNHKFDELLYLGAGSASKVLNALSASDTVFINLVQENTADTKSKVKALPIDELSTLLRVLRGRGLLIVLDLTASNNVPGSNDFSSFYPPLIKHLLHFGANRQDYNKANFWHYGYRWNGQHWGSTGSRIGGCRLQ